MMRRGFLAGMVAMISGCSAEASRSEAEPSVPPGEVRDETWFWRVMSSAKGRQPAHRVEALMRTLRTLSPDEIHAFVEAFEARADEAYRWDLWGACYVIHGGASDDGFYYFRSWLIAEGKERFEAALATPDDLAEMISPLVIGSLEIEGISGSAMLLWEEKTGRSFPPGGAGPSEPSGEPFKEGDRWLAAHYPKLWARFGDRPLI